MRACFLGQNVTALGYGVAIVQTPPLPEPQEKAEREAPQPPPPPQEVKTPEAA